MKIPVLKGVKLLALMMLAALGSSAQTGTITGTVLDEKTGESLPGAVALIENSNQGASSDIDGQFVITVKPGTYTVVVRCISYQPRILTGLVVTEGGSTPVRVKLAPATQELKSVEVTSERITRTGNAVLMEMKEARQIVNGISSEQIARSQDRNAAQAMQRIPGVTIIGNRFVMIRGVSDRYNTVMINNAISPGTEVDRRSFSFDIIQTSLIDRMLVYKSGAAELPGDFAGGVIKIFTASVPEQDATSAGFSVGYRAGTTFGTSYHTNGSSTDLLGFDNGFRQLPSGFSANLNAVSTHTVEQLSRTVPNNFLVKEGTAYPDLRFNAQTSRRFSIGSMKAGHFTALSYGSTWQYQQATRTRYLEYDSSRQASPLHSRYVDDQYSRNVRIGALSNWMLTSGSNRYEFRNMFNQLGENETIIRNGVSTYQRADDSLRNYSFRYTSRSIYSGQLSGKHELGGKTDIDWVAGLSYIKRDVPDLRRLRTYKKTGTPGPYSAIIPSGATTFDASRFYSDLRENTLMQSASLEHRFYDGDKDTSGLSLKAGYYLERKSRNFQARWMSYKSRNNQAADSLSSLPLDQIFAPQNIHISRGLFLAEGTNPSDKYDAQNLLTAGYASLSMPWKKITLSAGARVEYNRLSLQSATALFPVEVDNPVLSVLPFVNAGYSIRPDRIVRLAYSATVNRPEFREIAPFLFYDFDFNFDVVGNPALKVASIHNVDLRYEIYPGIGETFSFGLFYKRFLNPIENYIRQGADNPIYTFSNALYAQNYGAEVELRKSLDNVSSSRFVKNLSLVFNAALISSKVDLGAAVTSQDAVRPLQGQSPYLVNMGLYYSSVDKSLSVSALYNIVGRRIFIVGDRVNPTVYEMPRHALDLTVSKKISEKMEIRLGVQDVLNYEYSFIQDSDLDAGITRVDESVLSYRRGSSWVAGLNYRF
jgi:TonB-dependent receptor